MINALKAYGTISYLIFLITNILFLTPVKNWDAPAVVLAALAVLFYPVLEILPAMICSLAALKLKAGKKTMGAILFLTIAPLHLLMLFDAALYYRYGYHINMHIINIFVTPGGFEAMGLRPNEMVTIGLGIILFLVLHGVLIGCVLRFEKLSLIGKWLNKKSAMITAALLPVIFGVMFFTYSYSHYKMNPVPLMMTDAIPFYIRGTSGTLFKRLGIRKPDRDAVRLKLRSKGRSLANYPQKAIRRKEHKKYNIVWLACESWAKRMFTPQIMPRTSEFAKRCVVFDNHFSGGNVTRQGVFSMFYALPGSYWQDFLSARRGPLFIDWLIEDGYNIDCFTSSKFTYPEFDQTVFFEVPSANMLSDAVGESWKRDQRNVARVLECIGKRSAENKPFFTFFFLESPHHPYVFPDDAIIFKDYINPFNAAEVSPKDSDAIIKRAANACHHLDMCLGKIFKFLEEKKLLDNTIVVLCGDHGEEYFEKGYLGHSSKFVNEQTKTTLLIYYPGIKPEVYRNMSSHLDIVPMLAELMGVENPPQDYSCGMNLLSKERPERVYSIIANWDEVFFAGKKYKTSLPLSMEDVAKQTVSDADDRPVDDVNLFYREYKKELIQVQRDLNRFSR